MDELAPKVTVGEWINIDNFSLTGAPRTYRTTKNPKKMNFLHNTDISESTLQIEDDFLDLVDFDTILSGKPDTNILIGKCWLIYLNNIHNINKGGYIIVFIVVCTDVIGQVLDLGDLEKVHCTGGKERTKLEFTLRDVK